MAFGTLRNGIWDPTQLHLGPYAMAFGTLRNGIWDPTQLHLGPYAMAFGTLRNGIGYSRVGRYELHRLTAASSSNLP